jgi:hypothetical protein
MCRSNNRCSVWWYRWCDQSAQNWVQNDFTTFGQTPKEGAVIYMISLRADGAWLCEVFEGREWVATISPLRMRMP